MKGDQAATTIKNCRNQGSVSGQDLYVAGIAANSARAEGLVSVESCTNNGEVTSTGTTEFIGNLRGNTTIVLGKGNIIGAGLKALPLDPSTETGISIKTETLRLMPTANGLHTTKLFIQLISPGGVVSNYDIEAPVMKSGGKYKINLEFEEMKPYMYLTSTKIDDWTEKWIYRGEILNPED